MKRRVLMCQPLKIVAVIAFILIFLIPIAVSMKPPSEYGYKECELIAKDFQREFGGSLVFIQPLKENGAYNLCDYCGHWMNKKYISGNKQEYYFDWSSQWIFSSETEIENWWFESTGQKVEIFDLEKRKPPFNIRWQYG